MFKTPLPHLHARLSPCQNSSKTKLSTPRTFSDILPWSEFTQGAYGLEESLDDVVVKYKIPSTTMEDATGLSSAADESEVRGVIVNLLYSINEAAKALGIQAECIGAGSGRTTSFMDLVLRKSGQLSDPNKLSSLVLGAGEVKGQWQLDLQPGETLEAVLRDPERVDAVLLALQQASFPLCSFALCKFPHWHAPADLRVCSYAYMPHIMTYATVCPSCTLLHDICVMSVPPRS